MAEPSSPGESPRELVSRCRGLRAPEEHQRLRFDLAAAFADAAPARIGRRLGSLDPLRQAQGFLMLAAGPWLPDAERLLAALASRDEDLTAAAAFCFTVHCGQDEAWQRRLLLGRDEHTAPPVSSEARYHLVRLMGFSGETGFTPVLWDMLRGQYHFFNARLVTEALELLGDVMSEDEDEKEEALQPISVVAFSNGEGIGLTVDEHFTGQSLCPSCRFFPCRVNRAYRVGIEDCKLWNRTDPETAGPLYDQRPNGKQAEDEDEDEVPISVADVAAAERAMTVAEGLLAESPSLAAIPLLCVVLSQADEKSVLVPVAWVRLARCLEAGGEAGWACIARREALRLRLVLGASFATEQADLDSFVAGGGLPSFGNQDERFWKKAVAYKRLNLYVPALDFYVTENLASEGKSGSAWFEMGECHRELGELALAELCMRLAARTTGDSALRDRFTKKADEVRGQAAWGNDPGLAVERRVRARRMADRETLLGDPELRRKRASEIDVERAYWMLLLEENDPADLAAAVLERLRPDAPGNLLDLDEDLHHPIFFSLLQVAHRAVKEIHPELTPAEAREAPLELVLEALIETGRAVCAAALLAVQHDKEPDPKKPSPPGGRTSIQAAARFYVAQLLAAAEERPTPRADLADLAESALRLLDNQGPEGGADADTKELRRDIVSWLGALPG